MSANDIVAQVQARYAYRRENKVAEVAQASEAKQANLSTFEQRMARSAERLYAKQQAERESFIGQLGLDPDGLTGRAVNLGASAVSGTSRMAGHIAALPVDALRAMDMVQLSEAEINIINRYKQRDPSLTAAELNRINTPDREGRLSPLQRFERAARDNQTSRSINKAFDLSGIVHQGRRDELDEQLGEAFSRNGEQLSRGWENLKQGNVASGVGDMVGALARLGGNAVVAGVTNPGAAAEYVADTVPQLAVGLVPKAGRALLAASNVGYGSEAYQKGIENYAAKNNGALPPQDVRNRMALMAASAVAAEQVVDAKMLNLLKGGDPASKAAQEAVRKGFRDSLKRVGTATAGGTAGEALTEGYQTYAEGEASLKPATGEDIYKGAAIGGLTGGALSGGLSLLSESAKPTEQQAKENVDTKAKTKEVDAARATGDVSALIDPATPTYAPDAAVAALFSHSQLETTTQEQKEQNLEKARTIVAELERLKGINDSVAANTPETLKKEIATTERKLSALDPQDPQMAQASAYLQAIKSELAELESTDPATKKKIAAENARAELKRKQTERFLNQAKITLGELDSLVLPLQDAIDAVKTPAQPGEAPEVAVKREKSAQIIMTLAMSNAARLTTEDAVALAEDNNNSLKPEQRDYLRKLTSTRLAANLASTIDKVNQDVLVGTDKNMGIERYRKEIVAALNRGDTGESERLMSLLGRFERDHAQKAQLAQKGLTLKGMKNFPQLVRMDKEAGGDWKLITENLLSDDELDKNGGIRITGANLPNFISAEAKALTAFKAEMEALLGLQAKPEAAVTATQEAPAFTGEAEQSAENIVETQETEETSAEPQSTETSTVAAEKRNLDDINSELTAESGQDEDIDFDEDVEIEPEVNSEAGEVSPKLSKLADKSSETKPYAQQNYFALYFKQVFKALKSGGALMRSGNFLSAWVNGSVKPEEYLNLGRELTSSEVTALTHLKKTLVEWNQALKENLVDAKSKNEFFRHKDMMQHVMDLTEGQAPDIEENIKTAMSAGVYHFLMIQTSGAIDRTKEEILGMHGLNKDGYLSIEGETQLRKAIGHQDRTISELGKLAISYLGITDTKNTPQDLMPKLENALGTHMLFLMENKKLIKRAFVPTALLNTFFDKTDKEEGSDANEATEKTTEPAIASYNANEQLTTYIQLNRAVDRSDPTNENRLVPALVALKEANKRSYDIVTKLFSPTDETRYAKTEPSKFVQKYAKRTKQAISKLQRKVLSESQKVPHKAIPEMLSVARALGDDLLLKVAGAKFDTNLYHQDDWPSIDAQNQNLAHQLELMWDMLLNPANLEGDAGEFFITQEVWKNFRAGITTESLNMQTSKIHRFMFARPSWTTELKLDDNTLVSAFKIAVAQSFGLNIDAQSNTETLKKLEAELADESKGWKAALEAVQENLEGKELTAEQQSQVADLAASKEGMMTLQGMTAYAKYLDAVAKDEAAKKAIAEGKPGTRVESVSITMLIGVDGKTNGPMLTNLLLGAAYSVQDMYTMLNRGGMYQQGEGQPTHYSEYKSKGGSRDLYEDVMKTILNVAKQYQMSAEDIAEIKASAFSKAELEYAAKLFTQEQYIAFSAITKDLLSKDTTSVTSAGRKLVKTPLTAFNYGSALKKAVKGMEDAFIESLTTTIADMAAGKRNDLTAERYVDSVNALLVMGDPESKLMPKHGIPTLLKTSFTKDQEYALRNAFKTIMAAPVKEGMEGYFGSLIERRNSFNTTTKGTFLLYTKAYNALREKEVERLMDEDILPWREVTKTDPDDQNEDKTKRRKITVREPLRDLTYAEEDVIKAKLETLLPTMNTELSLNEGGKEGGLYLSQTENRQTYNPLYGAEVRVATPFQQATNSPKGSEGKILKSEPIIAREIEPGASALANSVQSTDSGGMHKALADMPEAMNVHDEAGQGIANITETAVAINRSIYLSILNYSPAREAANAVQRQVLAMAELLKTEAITKDELKGMLESISNGINFPFKKKGVTPKTVISYLVYSSFREANAADKIRLGSAATMEWMDQYPWEGGSFQVKDNLRKEAQAKLDALPTDISPELTAAIELVESVFGKPAAKKAEPAKPAAAKVEPVVATKKSVFGTLLKEGETAQIASDPQLIEFFERKPVTSVDVIMKGLTKLYGRTANENTSIGVSNRFNLTILNQLKGLIDPSMKVTYVTDKTPQADVIGLEKGAQGWFAFSEDGSKAEIYILGNMFKDSGVTPEVLLHELVHAAIARKIASIEAGNGTRSEVALLKELKALQSSTKDYVIDKDSNNEYAKGEYAKAEQFKAALNDIQEFVAWGMTNPEFQGILRNVSFQSKTKQNKLVKGMKAFVDTLLRMVYGVKPEADFNKTSDALTALISNVSGLLGSVDSKPTRSSDINTLAMSSNLSRLTGLGYAKAIAEALRPWGFVIDQAKLDPEAALPVFDAARKVISTGGTDDQIIRQSSNALAYLLQFHPEYESIRQQLREEQRDVWVTLAAKASGKGYRKGEAFTIGQRLALAELINRGLNKNNATGPIDALMRLVRKTVRAVKKEVQSGLQAKIDSAVEEILSSPDKFIPKIKDKYERVTFEAALEENVHAAGLLANLLSSKHVMLTGSLSLAPQGPVYRRKGNLLHDIDTVATSKAGAEKARTLLQTQYPGTVKVNEFETTGNNGKYTVQTFIVPPEDTTITNMIYRGRVVRGYSLVRNGKVVGTYRLEKNGNELRSGELAALLDIFEYADDNQVPQTRPINFKGAKGEVRGLVTNYEETFSAKLSMARDKDLTDYAQFIPEVQGEKITTLSMAAAKTVNAVDDYTTVELFDALKPTDPARVLAPSFSDKLRNYLDGIVTSLHGPLGSFADAMAKTTPNNPLSVYLKAIETGKAPFASMLSTSGLQGTAQEDFVAEQIEATVRAALNEDNQANTQLTYKKLADLFKLTRDNLKPEDLDDGKSSAQELQDRYDFLFRPTSRNGSQSDYLARFAAWGLANEKGSELLRFATDQDSQTRKAKAKPKGFGERLQRVFEDILSYFQERVAKTYRGQAGDQKLEALVGTLVDLEMKHRARVKLRLSGELNYLERAEDKAKELGTAAREKIEEFAGSEFFRKNSSAFIRAPAAVARMVAGQRVDIFMEDLQKLSEAHKKGKNIFSSTLRDVLGHSKLMQLLLRQAKSHERERKSIGDSAAKAVLSAFLNEGKDLTTEEKEAISAVFLRTGAHYLLKNNNFTLQQLEGLLALNGQELNKAIDSFKAKLDKFDPKFKAYFINEANVLGKYVATNEVNGEMLKMNAHNIAMMYGTDQAKSLSPAEHKEATEIIETLVSLYGLRYSHKGQKVNALKVLQAENARGGENGVEMVLMLHKQMEQQSLDRLFNGHPELMVHGYVPEIYNPHTELRVADQEEGEFLRSQGYQEHKLLKNDKADPDQSAKRVYVLKDGGLLHRVSGVFSLTSLETKGSKIHNGFLYIKNANGVNNASDNATVMNSRNAYLAKAFTSGPEKDLTGSQNYLAPVFNERGDIVNWRYLMTSASRDNLLERENRFEKIMGALTSSVYDKETSRDQNKDAIKALRDQYKTEYAKDPARYVKVGAESADPDLQEIWALLPENTRADVKRIWGEPGMMVRADSLDILFGYRKLSAGTMFKTAMNERKLNADRKAAGLPPLTKTELNQVKRIIVGTVEGLMRLYARHGLGLEEAEAEKYANRTANYVTRGERGFQELVREVKDIFVIKSVVVLVSNMVSNTLLLAMSGVSFADIAKHHFVAMKATTAYQSDSAELMNLERLVDTGLTRGQDKEIADRITALKDAIARNPVTPLIDAGLMPTIVEDVAAEDDPYSYKTALTRKVEGVTSKLNPNVVDAARLIYMTRDTMAYKGLYRMTQLSDFVGRYTIYQHLIDKKKDALTKEQAIQKASDYFINYDIPMHRGMQYVDDMGIIPFMKYFLRVQRVIADMFANNPARVLATIVLSNYMDLGSTVLDSSALARLGKDPFRGGAFEYPEALGQLGTINAAMAVLK